MNKIEKTFKKLRDIPNINCGGCLISAYSVYTKLINDPKIRIVQLSPHADDDNLENNRNFINGQAKYAYSGYHFGISFDFGKTVYDSNGLYTSYVDCYIIPRHKTYEFCKKALFQGNWNRAFDRQTYVPQIFKKLKINIKFLN